MLRLNQYRKRIRLDEPYEHESIIGLSAEERMGIVDLLLDILVNHEGLIRQYQIPDEYDQKREMLRALLNIRPPNPLKPVFLKNINMLLQYETGQKEITDCAGLRPAGEAMPAKGLKNRDKIFLWKGDITCLRADAIVNAANDRMLGCFQPLHNCIDNIIHSAAGPLLREDCRIIMDISRSPEQTGDAKITRAYNLPSKYVLHTVGPIIQGKKAPEFQAEQLASCYRSCLSLAGQIKDIRSIAFPCISTGVFSFPGDLASEIAVRTVDEWLSGNPHHFTHVIFNVFLEKDLNFYERVFSGSSS